MLEHYDASECPLGVDDLEHQAKVACKRWHTPQDRHFRRCVFDSEDERRFVVASVHGSENLTVPFIRLNADRLNPGWFAFPIIIRRCHCGSIQFVRLADQPHPSPCDKE